MNNVPTGVHPLFAMAAYARSMSAFSTVLVAIDGSSVDARLLDFAVDRVRGHASRILLVHTINHASAVAVSDGYAFDPSPLLKALDEDSAAVIAAAKQQLLDAGVTSVETVELEGPSAFAIVDYARTHAVDVIIMGTHGRTGLARFALGSVADGVLRSAHVPTFTLRATDDAPASRSGPLKRLLVAIDDSEVSDHGLAVAIALATDEGAEIRLCHVTDAGEAHLAVRRQRLEGNAPLATFATVAERLFDTAVARVRAHGLPVSCASLNGAAADRILEEAVGWNADAIVIGTHGRRGVQRLVLGSVAANVICHATVPVLAVPPQLTDIPR